jgi:ABC-type Fe3+/spermidine/putrescine transport system ATPase subunit
VGTKELTPGAAVLVSVRPHDIGLAPAAAAGGENAFAATVRRASYVGAVVEYQVAVEGTDVLLRVTAAVSPRFAPGDVVTILLAPALCVALPT